MTEEYRDLFGIEDKPQSVKAVVRKRSQEGSEEAANSPLRSLPAADGLCRCPRRSRLHAAQASPSTAPPPVPMSHQYDMPHLCHVRRRSRSLRLSPGTGRRSGRLSTWAPPAARTPSQTEPVLSV